MESGIAKPEFVLIYSLGLHPYLGYLIEPHIVQLNINGSLSLTYKRVFSTTVEEFSIELTDVDRKIIKILDEIEQSNLIKKYYKKVIRPLDYFSKIFDDKTYNILRLQIDKRLIEVLSLIGNRPLYKMSVKDGYPAETLITIAKQPVSVLFHFRRNEDETRYFPTLKYDGKRLDFMYKGAEVVVQNQAWLLLENVLYHFDQPMDGKKLVPFLNKRYIAVPRVTERRYFETFVKSLIERHHVYAEGFEIKTFRKDASPVLTYYQQGDDAFLSLEFNYGSYLLKPAMGDHVSAELEYDEASDEYTFYRIKRSLNWETKLIQKLTDLGLEFRNNSIEYFGLPSNDTQKAVYSMMSWLSLHHDDLTDLGFQIKMEAGETRYFLGKTSIDIEVQEENDWFDVKAVVYFGSYQIPFIELKDHIINHIHEFVLPNGEIAIIPVEWFQDYEHLFHFSSKKDALQLHKMHVGLINDLGEHKSILFRRKLEKLATFEQIQEVDPPANFNGNLRPYQLAGYHWYMFLREYRFGGVLADDMGLGKTIQTLALLQKVKEMDDEERKSNVSLLVLPTSLAYNWQEEAEKFAPKLKVAMHIGSHRAKEMAQLADFDLVITTYGIVRSDEELLKEFYFEYIILDESQNIKNPKSKSYKSIKLLKSRFKIALSGTPVENSVSDLWSQMHFCNPGMLGSYAYFQKEFVAPIQKKKDVQKSERLQAMIKPFVLRRTKNQVATELPPKTEQIIYCPMEEEQRSLYEKTKSEYRNVLLDKAVDKGNGQLTLLQGLMKLRQLANHPKLVDEDYELSSGKFDAAIEMLQSVSQEGNKVLIFSQFVKHLEIFKNHLEASKQKYSYLDGATKDRGEVVQEFKRRDDIKIFLISLKAGGVGLNLTEADYVFLLDPWWNPAVEQQAIDRAHRIGQDRNVFIYRFITKDTVEEKIVTLQNRKRTIASTLVTTEETFIKSLAAEDIDALFV